MKPKKPSRGQHGKTADNIRPWESDNTRPWGEEWQWSAGPEVSVQRAATRRVAIVAIAAIAAIAAAPGTGTLFSLSQAADECLYFANCSAEPGGAGQGWGETWETAAQRRDRGWCQQRGCGGEISVNINEHWHSIACRGLGTRGHEHTGYLPLVCKNLKLSAAVSSWWVSVSSLSCSPVSGVGLDTDTPSHGAGLPSPLHET